MFYRGEKNWEKERENLINSLVDRGYISSPRVIKAMKKVPRHLFIPESRRSSAYVDRPLSIGEGQTISAPHMVGMMTEYLDIVPDNKILEIGAGSGYQAAILAEIVTEGKIFSIERISHLAKFARNNLEKTGYKNVSVIEGEGTTGYEKEAPYDRIIVTAAAPHVPKALKEQLKEGGILLIPVGGRTYQNLMKIEKKKDGFSEKNMGGCVFVPLIGKDGW